MVSFSRQLAASALVVFLGLASAAPLSAESSSSPSSTLEARAGGPLYADKIIAAIMPSSTSCDGAESAADCATNEQAAPHFIAAFKQYNFYDLGSMAGMLALVAFESNELKYRHNISPGRPGQGTSNMQMIDYNTKYAQSIPALASGLTAAGGDANKILALVTPDEYNFGSAAWFLRTQCSDTVRSQLAKGDDAGFAAYMGCVGVDATDSGRTKYWTAAKTAFGL